MPAPAAASRLLRPGRPQRRRPPEGEGPASVGSPPAAAAKLPLSFLFRGKRRRVSRSELRGNATGPAAPPGLGALSSRGRPAASRAERSGAGRAPPNASRRARASEPPVWGAPRGSGFPTRPAPSRLRNVPDLEKFPVCFVGPFAV